MKQDQQDRNFLILTILPYPEYPVNQYNEGTLLIDYAA